MDCQLAAWTLVQRRQPRFRYFRFMYVRVESRELEIAGCQTDKDVIARTAFTAALLRPRLAEGVTLGGDSFRLVVLASRGIQVDVPAGWTSAWWVGRGNLEAQSTHFDGQVVAGNLMTWQDSPIRLYSHARVGAIGIAAPTRVWTQARGAGVVSRLLLPWQEPASREIRRLLLRTARLVRNGSAGAPAALGALLAMLHENQVELLERLPLCSGRTRQRREQVLMRLMRVRHMVRFGRDPRAELGQLAKVANYSPTHLIRLHREVFGETPAEYAMRLRVERSWALVRDTRMPIGDISEAVGFESKSAFCRSFKTIFGHTTSEVRRLAAQSQSRCGTDRQPQPC
jgi:AraC family transcriptional regulator